MAVYTLQFDTWSAGSMCERVDPVLHQRGQLEADRNYKRVLGEWERDDGWKKINKTSAGTVRRWLGIFSYTDRNMTPHVIAVGDDGNLYHDLNWNVPVTYYGTAVWDGTWVASGSAWRDMFFICLLRADGVARSIRYDGINGVAYDVGLAAPGTALAAVDNGVGGLVPADDYIIGYTFYDADNLWESGLSPVANVTVAADNSTIGLSAIAVSGAVGKNIYRRIYWSTNGSDFFRVNTAVNAELMNDTGTAYTINQAALSTVAYVHRVRAGNYNSCATLPNGLIVWAGAADENKPAMCQFSEDPDRPESLKLNDDESVYYSYAGHDDDPIVAAYAGRNGGMIGKRRAAFRMDASCLECEALLAQVGVCSWASIQVWGSTFVWWSPQGAVMTQHTAERDFSFVGPNPFRFDLSLTAAAALKNRLRYAGSIHNKERSTITWFLQLCSSWPAAAGEHADMAVVWDYGFKSSEHPNGVLYIRDLGIDYACAVPIEGSEEVQYWGAFPMGFIGKLWDGQHGDGTDTMASATVTAVSGDGLIVTIDEASLDAAELLGDGLKGTVAYTTQFCILPVPVCFRPGRTIIDHSQNSALGRRLTFESDPGISVGNTIWFGGFHSFGIINGLGSEVPGRIKRILYAEMFTKGS